MNKNIFNISLTLNALLAAFIVYDHLPAEEDVLATEHSLSVEPNTAARNGDSEKMLSKGNSEKNQQLRLSADEIEIITTAELVNDFLSRSDAASVASKIRKEIEIDVLEKYGDIIDDMGLGQEARAKLVELLCDQQSLSEDVLRAALRQGLNPIRDRDEIQNHMNAMAEENRNNITDIVGTEGYDNLKSHKYRLEVREIVDTLQTKLFRTQNPLSVEQAKLLEDGLVSGNNTRSDGSREFLIGDMLNGTQVNEFKRVISKIGRKNAIRESFDGTQ